MEEHNDEFLCFVRYMGKDLDGKNAYDFLFTDTIEEFWIDGSENVPVCLQKDFEPTVDMYVSSIRIKTDMTLKLGQDNCCLSYQDVMDKILAIAYEDISEYSEYPDERLVVFYGEAYADIIELLKGKKCEIIEN